MTPQEIFNIAVLGVVSQGRKSANERGSCMYRGPDGLKCAVGWLIDDETAKRLDGLDMPNIKNCGNLPDALQENIELLADLQWEHDTAYEADFIPDFMRGCERVAKEHSLIMPEFPFTA